MSGRWFYTARLVPLGKQVNIPHADGTPSYVTFHDRSFESVRRSRTKPDVCLDHDRAMVVGRVERLYTSSGWWCADWELPVEPTGVWPVGQPVSIGLDVLSFRGVESAGLREVSLVRHGAVKGAEITRRYSLPPLPPKPLLAPTPAGEPARTAEAAEVIHHPQRVIHRDRAQARHAAEGAEMRRRLDWLEKHTGRYDVEAVILGMQRELNGPSIYDVAR